MAGPGSSTRTELSLCLAGALVACEFHDFGPDRVCDAAQSVDGACDIFTAAQWAAITELSPMPGPPRSPTNRFADDPQAAALGQRLFFDRCFAGSQPGAEEKKGRSCATCHRPDAAFQETLPGPDAKRNTPSLIDVASYQWWPWDGRRDSLWSMNLVPAEGPPLQSDRLTIAWGLRRRHWALYEAVFCAEGGGEDCDVSFEDLPDAWGRPPSSDDTDDVDASNAWHELSDEQRVAVDRMFANFGKALAAYERRLVSEPTRFDEFVAGDPDALDDAEKRGLQLFVGAARCDNCHSGPTLSDDRFHRIGLPPDWFGFGKEARGRAHVLEAGQLDHPFNTLGPHTDSVRYGRRKYAGLLHEARDPSELVGAFRTKHLRGVSTTGRYMHAGVFASLDEVVSYYAERRDEDGVRDPDLPELDLSDEDIANLVAFLEALEVPPVSPYVFDDAAQTDGLGECFAD